MSRLYRVRGLLLGTLAVLCAAGCGNEAAQFNDTLVRGTIKVETARKKFDEALKGGNAGSIRVTHTGFLGALGEVKREVAAVKVPSSTSALLFAEKFQTFLQNYEDTVRGVSAERVRMVEGPEEATADKLRELALKEAKAYQQLQSQMDEIRELQRAFAKEHNIRLKAPAK
ncbi:MAG: hypothetical protein L0Z62_03620 [Gemmataceae bacterium]|nr:hypothetical protein [Gemmataceae bacterium]